MTNEHQTLAEETRFVQFEFFKILLFVLKRKFSLQFVSFICRCFLKSETSLNFSNSYPQDFVKAQNFEGVNCNFLCVNVSMCRSPRSSNSNTT